MSDGATISAPAATWDTAVRAQQFQGIVVDDAAVADNAAVAVRHIFAKTNVGDDEQVGIVGLERAHGALHDSVVGVGARRDLIFFAGKTE